MIGKKFGKLTIVSIAPSMKGYRMLVCRCDCGNPKTVKSSDMINGRVRSCGCLRQQIKTNRARRLAILKARARVHAGADATRKVHVLADLFAGIKHSV